MPKIVFGGLCSIKGPWGKFSGMEMEYMSVNSSYRTTFELPGSSDNAV